MLHKQCLKTLNCFLFFFFFVGFVAHISAFETAIPAHISMFHFIFQPILKGQAVKCWTCMDEGIKGLCTCQVAWKPLRPF